MKYDPAEHHRRSIRLRTFDYAQPGAYFVTVCTHGRACLFGDVVGGEMQLNESGRIARTEWVKTAEIRPNVQLHPHEFVVMPNHIHGILWLVGDDVGATHRVAPTGESRATGSDVAIRRVAPTGAITGSLGAILAQYKSIVTKRIRSACGVPARRVWQRGYYEHIIRDDRSLDRIREYIVNNPLQWELDREHPTAPPTRRIAPPQDDPWAV